MRISILVAILVTAVAGFAIAQPVDQRTARKMLFNADGFELDVAEPGALTATELGFFQLMVDERQNRTQFGRVARYYGAIAISPSVFDGGPAALLADPNSVPFKFETGLHSVAAAEAMALSGCNALVQDGQDPCVIAARVVPKRYKPQPLTLSTQATEAFKAYRRAKKPKAFAASPSNAGYGLAEGATALDEALFSCNAAAARAGVNPIVRLSS